MADRFSNNPIDYILPLNINKLEGRMMYIPASKDKNREILLVPGQHSLLERWWNLALNFADYGSLTMPDMPGFGGMDSFETIGIKPDIDAYADYLAAFIKLRFNRKRVSLVGLGFGFAVITRMLQKYPQLTKKVDMLVCLDGYMHKDDFRLSLLKRRFYYTVSKLLAAKPVMAIKPFFINYPIVKYFCSRSASVQNSKMTKAEFDALVLFETRLWQVNDLRTHWLTTSEVLNLDNCIGRVNLTVTHIMSKADQSLNNDYVREHMKVVFTGYKCYLTRGKPAGLSLLADKEEAGMLLPTALRNRLLKSK